MTLRFGTDGVRAEALTVLTTEYTTSLARSAATVLGGTVQHNDAQDNAVWLVGRDTRESGPALEAAVVAGLISAGVTPLLLGVVPTPALAWMSAQMDVPAVMITASHNPWHDNGLKIFAAGGLKLTDEVERSIEAALHDELPVSASASASPVVTATTHDWREGYVAHLAGIDGSLHGLRVVLDCANGAAFEAAPAVFRAVGADVVVIHDQPNGRNINDSCGATDTASLGRAVVEHRAHLGLAFDGDGDRVIAVDHRGKVIDGDRMIALAALQLRDEGALHHNTVVVTVMSNLGFHKAMSAANVQVVTTAVGDRYVLEALAAGGFSVGGEQSGHIIYRDLATTGDGVLAGLRLAQFVHDSGRPLAELADEVMATYPQVLVNVKVRNRHPQVAEELAAEIAVADAGLGGEGRVLVRASGTEPLIRVMVEASTQAAAQQVADGLAATVLRRFG
ncbi:MAG: phosphoglucosamine mutase [Actinomycetia bacterium]|nr:phosphoglucosamine mutase [Actinomycetes bacterium]